MPRTRSVLPASAALALTCALGPAAPPAAAGPAYDRQATTPTARAVVPSVADRLARGEELAAAHLATMIEQAAATTPSLADLPAAWKAAGAANDGMHTVSLLGEWGDLDNDGTVDVMVSDHRVVKHQFGTRSEPLKLRAHSGADGTMLWEHVVDAVGLSYATPARIGSLGRPGTIVVTTDWQQRPAPIYFEIVVTFTGVDSGGVTAWRSSFSTQFGVASTDGLTGFGLANVVAGDATDVVVTTASVVYARLGRIPSVLGQPEREVGSTVTATRLRVVDGRDGTVRDVGAPDVRPSLVQARTAPAADFSLDGLTDLLTAYVFDDGSARLVARRATDGAVLWDRETPAGHLLYPTDLVGDLVGTAAPDVLVYLYSSDRRRPVQLGLVDGASGALTVHPDSGFSHLTALPGDVDGDGRLDVLRADPTVVDDQAALTVRVHTGAGELVYTRAYPDGPALGSGATEASAHLALAGDLDADGVEDLFYVVDAWNDEFEYGRATGYVSVRDGTGITAPEGVEPLGDAVDGDGADTYRLGWTDEGLSTLTVHAGATARRYWRAAFSSAAAQPQLVAASHARAVRLSGAGSCADVLAVVTTYGKGGTGPAQHVQLLDGATGTVRWTVPLRGLGPEPTVSVTGPVPTGC